MAGIGFLGAAGVKEDDEDETERGRIGGDGERVKEDARAAGGRGAGLAELTKHAVGEIRGQLRGGVLVKLAPGAGFRRRVHNVDEVVRGPGGGGL